MFRTNYDYAYLNDNNGVISVKLSGKAENRIDNVNIVIDNHNNCQINYIDYHWRLNNSYNLFSEYYSSFSINKVAPEYIEDVEQIKYKWFFGGYKVIIKRVKDGLIKLNNPPVQHTIRANNWFIEFNERSAIQNTIQNTIL